MSEVLPMPSFGDLFTDTRGGDRTMRVSYHSERGTVVMSLWLGPVCRGSFRLDVGDARRLASTLDEILTSVDSTVTAGPSDGPTPEADAPDPAGVGAAESTSPPIDRPNEVTGAVDSTRLASVTRLRVA
ncbi:hypothetical protein [Plantactinospora soyae]|uniref:Uncharacterized protein n=1 Tax=Plantactinospora soyae TaxID=1544732 RepID=A0A927M869_9ACTN|nr:hypothetical protein [Plantactinospora soyae]MBE1488376.1 hypothetical protein [Plantactinospora soyae]